MKKAILFFILIYTFIPIQSQIIYYVRENGVDDLARCGVTEDEAFRTIHFAIKQCSALSMIIDVAGTLAHRNDTIPPDKTVTMQPTRKSHTRRTTQRDRQTFLSDRKLRIEIE